MDLKAFSYVMWCQPTQISDAYKKCPIVIEHSNANKVICSLCERLSCIYLLFYVKQTNGGFQIGKEIMHIILNLRQFSICFNGSAVRSSQSSCIIDSEG